MRGYLLFLCVLWGFSPLLAKKKDPPTTTYQFIQNNGQFASPVLYKAEIPNGALFAEKNAFTYHFYNAPHLNHAHHLGLDNSPDDQPPVIQFHAYQVAFKNGQTSHVSALEKRRNFFNYYLGKNPEYWAHHVPAFNQLRYHEVYPHIDIQLYGGTSAGLKYDIIVAPGGRPEDIQLHYQHVDSMYLKSGKLVVKTSVNTHVEVKPYAYQIVNGKQKKIPCKYELKDQVLGYSLPNGYDTTLPLIIDPVLVFSSYTGASSNNFGYTATYDKFGYLYSGSSAFGLGYPTTWGAYQDYWAGGTGGSQIGVPGITGTDIAITKWDTSGTALIYSTYLGGSSDELPHSIVVTDFNELYVMGSTGSTNFPVTVGAFDTSFNMHPAGPLPVSLINGLGAYYLNGADIVITKFDSNGTALDASTYLGGTQADGINNGDNKYNYADEIRGEIDLDHAGKVYIVSCTRSSDNPTTTDGFQTTKPSASATQIDGIVYKLNHNLSVLEYSSYIGGTNADAAFSIAITDSNDIYVSGGTRSTDFPVTTLGHDTTFSGVNDGFILHLTEDGNTVLDGTYIGSTRYDQSYFVELDHDGNTYVFGQTASPVGHMVHNAAYHDSAGGQFITKYTPALDSVIWSTRFGTGDTSPDISPTAFLVDLCNAIYLSGWGSSIQGDSLSTLGLDTAGNPYQGTTDGNDFYVMVLSDDASTLQYASFFGGSAQEHVDGGTSRFDRKGKVYQAVCACGSSNDFPTHPNPGAVSNVNGSPIGCNLAVFKMDFLLPVVVADFDAPSVGCAPFTVPFVNLSLQQSATTFFWDFGDGNTSTQINPTHTYQNPGIYTITLVVDDAATCNLNDSISKQITILANGNMTLGDAILCPLSNGVQIGIPQNNDPNINVIWTPALHLSDTSVSNPVATPPQTTTYTLRINNGICEDTLVQTVVVDSIQTQIIGDSFVCLFDAPFELQALTNGQVQGYHWSNFSDFSDTINAAPLDSSIWVTPNDSINWYYLAVTSNLGCPAIDSFPMVVSDYLHPLEASFINPGPGCAPFDAQFLNTTDSSQITAYYWDFGNGQTSTVSHPNMTYPNAGNYTVTLIAYDSAICPQSDTFTAVVQVRADSNYTVNQLACYGQDTQIGIPPDSVPGTTYTWIPTSGLSDPTISNPTINTTTNTSYLLIVQHVCTDSVTNNITVDPIFAATDSLYILCSDQPVIQTQGTSMGTGVSFVWSTNSEFTDTLNSALTDSSFTANQTATFSTYYFGVTSAQGCFETDSITGVIADRLIETNGDSFICQTDTVVLSAVNLFPYNTLNYYWTPTQAIIGAADTATIITAPLQTTAYYLEAINDSGCVFMDTVVVEVSYLNDTVVMATTQYDSVYSGGSTQLKVTPLQDYLYQWIPSASVSQPNQSRTLAFPTQTTTFIVRVSDPKNPLCNYTDSVSVRVYEINCGEPDIRIPNAFSPNNDGENDEYLIDGRVLEQIHLQIFNRWGEMVFETTELHEAWDGTYNNKALDAAVFVYQLEATCVDGQSFTKKGNISLVK